MDPNPTTAMLFEQSSWIATDFLAAVLLFLRDSKTGGEVFPGLFDLLVQYVQQCSTCSLCSIGEQVKDLVKDIGSDTKQGFYMV